MSRIYYPFNNNISVKGTNTFSYNGKQIIETNLFNQNQIQSFLFNNYNTNGIKSFQQSNLNSLNNDTFDTNTKTPGNDNIRKSGLYKGNEGYKSKTVNNSAITNSVVNNIAPWQFNKNLICEIILAYKRKVQTAL